MTANPLESQLASSWPRRLPFYYGWICVVVAAFAMTATLPGRTHGLGLITEPLLADLQMERTVYARINLICTLLGAAFCIPIGILIDRLGVRKVLTANVALLGLSVLAMARVEGPTSLTATLLLVRGFGQGALSVVSMAIVGKWFHRRLGPAMGLFTVLLTFGFIGSVVGMDTAVKSQGWREPWMVLGYSLLAFVPFAWLLTRDTPETCGLQPDDPLPTKFDLPLRACPDFTLAQAVRTPVFWIFCLGTASFNLVWSAVTLFNESILVERGFSHEVTTQIMGILTGVGLISNVIAGKLATRDRLGWLMGIALLILSATLAAVPQIHTLSGLRWYAVSIGLTGGIITVIFFAAWKHLFGQSHLGRIQSLSQIVSVLASAVGPLLLAEGRVITGSYDTTFQLIAVGVGLVGLASFFVKSPQRSSASAAELNLSPVPRLEPVQE